MQYMILNFEDAATFETRNNPDKAPAYWGSWIAYSQALAASGVMVGGNGLQPPVTATTLRLRDGKRHVQDGPFADAKEQLGGYFIIDVADLDTALDWAARSPAAAYGSVEVRPVMAPPPKPA